MPSNGLSFVILLLWSMSIGAATLARPLDGDDFTAYSQGSPSDAYPSSLLAGGGFARSQNGFPAYAALEAFGLPQLGQQSTLNSFANPFNAGGFGGVPGFGGGIPNIFG